MSDIHDRIERLESLVEQQQATIDEQRERIDELESKEASSGGPLPMSRRTALTTGGVLALLGMGSGTAAADPSGHLGSSSDPLATIYTEQVAGGLTGGTTVDDLLGTGLTTKDVGGTTELRAAVADTDDDGLLEPTDGSHRGIDIVDLRVNDILDSDGNSHLRLRNNGPLDLAKPLDVNANAIRDSGGDALQFDGSQNVTVPPSNTLAVDGSLALQTTVVSSDYTTNGEARIAVETSGSAVTVTLASADATDGRRVTVVDKDGNAATNAITVETEGSETIHPGGVGSKQLTVDGGLLVLENIAGTWYTSRNVERETVGTDRLQVGSADAVTGGPLGDSGDWIPLAGYKVTDSRLETTYNQDGTSYEDSDFNREERPYQSAFIPLNQLKNITNVTDVGLSWAGYVKGTEDTDAERINVKIGYKFEDLPATEESSGHTVSPHTSDIASISDFGADSRTNVYMKTSTGTGYLEANMTQYLWVKLK